MHSVLGYIFTFKNINPGHAMDIRVCIRFFRFDSVRFIRFLYFGLYDFIHIYGSVSVITIYFRFGFGNNQNNQSLREFLNDT